jgi:hypothetical protein
MKRLPIILTAPQLIEFLGQDKADVYRALRAGKIPGAYLAGNRWFIGRDTFLKGITEWPEKPTGVCPNCHKCFCHLH